MTDEQPPEDREQSSPPDLEHSENPAEDGSSEDEDQPEPEAADPEPSAAETEPEADDPEPENDAPADQADLADAEPDADLRDFETVSATGVGRPETDVRPRSTLTGPVPPPAAAAPVAPPPVAAAATTLPTAWPDPAPASSSAGESGRFEGLIVTAPIVILGALVTIAFVMFVGIEPTPRWLLLFAAVIAVLGTDGALRRTWPRPFERAPDTADSTPYLFLPALAVIAAPMLIEHNVGGYLVLPAALLAGGAFTAVIAAQVSSVRVAAPAYPLVRLISTAAVYFSAFALFSLSYVLDVELPAAIAAVGVVAAMLGVELFREGQVDPLETLLFSIVTGVILGEVRWVMYYVPVGGYLAGLALLLAFFLVTGLLHSHLTRRLNSTVTLEYAGIVAAGLLLVVIANQAGLG